MLDRVRTSLHRVLVSPALEGFLPVRVPKDLARRLNVALGEPICSSDELTRRREAAAKLEALKKGVPSTPAASEPEVAAPVVVYVEGDRNARFLGRIKELLEAKRIAFSVLDVGGDANTKNFVMREAQVKEDELPVVFVASTPIGGYAELVDWDVSGRLAKAVYPTRS